MKTAPQLAAELVRPEIRAINAYHVAPATGLIKLDAMENPYRLPEALRAELGRALAEVAINRYPDASGAVVKTALRETATLGIEARHALILGNGSDELIQIVATTLAKPGATMLAVEPSFVMYKANAMLAQMRYAGVPLRADFTLDTDAVLAAIEREKPALAERMRGVPAIAVRADERVARGGCILETPLGVIDARLEVQLAAIGRALAQVGE